MRSPRARTTVGDGNASRSGPASPGFDPVRHSLSRQVERLRQDVDAAHASRREEVSRCGALEEEVRIRRRGQGTSSPRAPRKHPRADGVTEHSPLSCRLALQVAALRDELRRERAFRAGRAEDLATLRSQFDALRKEHAEYVYGREMSAGSTRESLAQRTHEAEQLRETLGLTQRELEASEQARHALLDEIRELRAARGPQTDEHGPHDAGQIEAALAASRRAADAAYEENRELRSQIAALRDARVLEGAAHPPVEAAAVAWERRALSAEARAAEAESRAVSLSRALESAKELGEARAAGEGAARSASAAAEERAQEADTKYRKARRIISAMRRDLAEARRQAAEAQAQLRRWQNASADEARSLEAAAASRAAALTRALRDAKDAANAASARASAAEANWYAERARADELGATLRHSAWSAGLGSPRTFSRALVPPPSGSRGAPARTPASVH